MDLASCRLESSDSSNPAPVAILKKEKIINKKVSVGKKIYLISGEIVYSMVASVIFVMLIWFILFSFLFFVNKEIFFFTRNSFLFLGVLCGLISGFGEKSSCPIIRGLKNPNY